MEKTWKPVAAGVLDIISGAFGLICVLGMITGIIFITSSPFFAWDMVGMPPGVFTGFIETSLVILAILHAIVSVLSLIGGIYAIQRRKWGWALTGAIAAIGAAIPLGIVAIVFTTLSRSEFE